MKERNYGIELLRLVLMFMICTLHILGQGGVLHAYEEGTTQFKLFYLLETISYPAVNSFALISGYCAQNRPPNYKRLLGLWLQVLFYSCFVTLFFMLVGLSKALETEPFEVFMGFFPVSSNQYWYFTCYFGAFFFFYSIRLFVFQLKETAAKKLLIVFFILFAFMGMNDDIFRFSYGYSMAWLLVLYTIGLLIKKCHFFEKTKTPILILLIIFCTLLTWLQVIATEMDSLLHYTSPTVSLCGMLLVILFSRFKLKGKIIGKVSPYAFGIYLFQLNFIVWYDLKGAIAARLSSDIGIALLQILLFSAILFICGLTVDFIRQKLFDLLRIRKVSERIYDEVEKTIDNRFFKS